MKRSTVFTLMLLLGLGTQLNAAADPMADVTNAPSQSAVTTTTLTYTLSTLTPTVFTQLTKDQQQTIANQWHLSVDDYARYLALMDNTVNGFYYKDRNLDPSWILGINAKDDSEREKYATIAIQNERERITKELLFQKSFTQLQQTLYPNQKPINGSYDTIDVKSNSAATKALK